MFQYVIHFYLLWLCFYFNKIVYFSPVPPTTSWYNHMTKLPVILWEPRTPRKMILRILIKMHFCMCLTIQNYFVLSEIYNEKKNTVREYIFRFFFPFSIAWFGLYSIRITLHLSIVLLDWLLFHKHRISPYILATSSSFLSSVCLSFFSIVVRQHHMGNLRKKVFNLDNGFRGLESWQRKGLAAVMAVIS